MLPIAIMAHNEERLICRAIQSCLAQTRPLGFLIRIIVVANGCTDRTEERVSDIRRHFQEEVVLISMKEKGKTRALNTTLNYLAEMEKGADIPYVVFLDADCEFVGNGVLTAFMRRFEEVPSICAVGATCVPNTFFSPSTGLVSRMYQALNELSRLLPENGISGGAYCIRLDVLKQVSFPEVQMADDMYLSSKLDGWMLRDPDINVAYAIPGNLAAELRKRVRQEMASQQYIEYHRKLSQSGRRSALFDNPLDDKYRWWGFDNSQALRMWFRVKGGKFKLLIGLNVTVRLIAKIGARRNRTKIERDPGYDYWKVER